MKVDPKFIYYAALGFLPPLIERLSAMDKATMDKMLWPQWIVLILMPVYSMLLGLKALTSNPPKAPEGTITDTTMDKTSNGQG